jgi:SAM-dependent methyltransferase
MPRLFDEVKAYDNIAPRYHAEVASPFAPGVNFRLPADVRRAVRRWRHDGTANQRVVIDFGCGIGEALALVAGKVGLAAGIDFSAGMLNECQKRLDRTGVKVERLSGPRSLRLLRRLLEERQGSCSLDPITVLAFGNLLRLDALAQTCDLAFANHLTPPSAAKAYRMFQQIAACVRPGGVLIGVFASLDAIHHLNALVEKDRGAAALLKIDPATGMYIHENEELLKFFTPEEIKLLASENGLIVEQLEKILYPWILMRRHGWGYYPRSPRLWDWYLVARKRGRSRCYVAL